MFAVITMSPYSAMAQMDGITFFPLSSSEAGRTNEIESSKKESSQTSTSRTGLSRKASDSKPETQSEIRRLGEAESVADTALDLAASTGREEAEVDWIPARQEFRSALASGINSGRPFAEQDGDGKPTKRLEFQLRGGVEYNDNVFIDRNQKQSDIIVTAAPTVEWNGGDFRRQRASYMSAAYTASAAVYLEGSVDPTVDHALRFAGHLKRAKVTIPFALSIVKQDAAFVELGGRETAIQSLASVGVDVELNRKTSVGVSMAYTGTDYEKVSDYQSYYGELYGNYRYSSNTLLGVAWQYGTGKTSDSSAQNFNHFLVRGNQRLGGKLSLDLEAGLSLRDLESGQRSDFIYRAGLSYKAGAKTTARLEGYRRLVNSAFTEGAGYVAEGVRFGLDHELNRRTKISLSGGLESTNFYAADVGVSTDRQEEFAFFNASLLYEINRSWSAECYYFYGSNESSDPTLGFTNQRLGLGLNWSY